MTIRSYNALPPEAAAIREAVFMREQGFAEEFDDIDSRAVHLVLFADGVPAATCRYYWNKDQGCHAIGRIAVQKPFRGRGLGAAVLRAAEAHIARAGGCQAVLAAQVRAGGFYQKQGYLPCGAPFDEEGCPHIWMRKALPPASAV